MAGGFENNIYMQIGIVLLIGLAAKSAILIVEFAKVKREAGESLQVAAAESARLRFRAILMTAFSSVLGFLPLMLATGAGANSRQSLGTAVCFGMMAATVGAVLFVPTLYVMVQGASEFLGGAGRKKKEEETSFAVRGKAPFFYVRPFKKGQLILHIMCGGLAKKSKSK